MNHKQTMNIKASLLVQKQEMQVFKQHNVQFFWRNCRFSCQWKLKSGLLGNSTTFVVQEAAALKAEAEYSSEMQVCTNIQVSSY